MGPGCVGRCHLLVSAFLYATSATALLMPACLYVLLLMSDRMNPARSNDKPSKEKRGRSAQSKDVPSKRDSTPKPAKKVGDSSQVAPSNPPESSGVRSSRKVGK